MKQKLTLRRIIIILTGLCFAVYAAYNVFVLIKDGGSLPTAGIIISGLVAFLFAVLSIFAFTSDMRLNTPEDDDIRLLAVRRIFFGGVLVAVWLLKLRMAGQVAAYVDVSMPHTILYAGAYVATQLALLALFVLFVFILPKRPFFPRLCVLLPLLALLLFVAGFVCDTLLFFGFHVMVEASPLRTMLVRPVFYLGFIGLSLYFLLPPPMPSELPEEEEEEKKEPD